MDLDNITSVEGDLYIGNNSSLASLCGLDSINSVKRHLYIVNNNALTSLNGLDNITSVGESLYIKNNNALISFCALSPSMLADVSPKSYSVYSKGFNPTLSDLRSGNCERQ